MTVFGYRAQPSSDVVQRWQIASRYRRTEFDIVAPADFRLKRPAPFPAEQLLANSEWSLYCLDLERQVAYFVELPAQVDLASAPFYYATQFREATGVVTVPFAIFESLAAKIEFDPARLVFIYSVGRCGSTLLSATFRRVPRARSLSEPDVFSQLLAHRGWQRTRETEVRGLLAICLRWVCRHISTTRKTPPVHVIKFRAHGIALGDLLTEAAPGARVLFLYRDARPWFDSVFRAFFRDLDFDSPALRRSLEDYFSGMVRLVAEYRRPERLMELAEIWGLHWADAMEHALALTERGQPMLRLRYEDMLRAPAAAVRAMLEHSGLEGDPADIVAALEHDSQSGTRIARMRLARDKMPVPARQREIALGIIATRPVVSRPDFILPGTWQPLADASRQPKS